MNKYKVQILVVQEVQEQEFQEKNKWKRVHHFTFPPVEKAFQVSANSFQFVFLSL